MTAEEIEKNKEEILKAVGTSVRQILKEERGEIDKLILKYEEQLKNRDGDDSTIKRFLVGVDRGKMKLYNIENTFGKKEDENVSIMDNTNFGIEEKERGKKAFDKSKFRGFN